MVKVRFIGTPKRIMGEVLELNVKKLNDILEILKDKGIRIEDLIILVNGIDHSLIDEGIELSNEDLVTIASVVHGG